MSSNKNVNKDLPEGWILCSSKSKTGRKYYFNRRTGKSSWTKPKDEAITKPVQNQKKGKEKNVKEEINNIIKNNLKRKSGGDNEPSCSNKKKKEDTKPQSSDKQKLSPKKTPNKQKYTPNKSLNTSHGSQKNKHTPSPAKKDHPKASPNTPKNIANTRLSHLRAELSEQAKQESLSPQNKSSPHKSPEIQNESSPSQFLTANKIISSMKAQLPDCSSKHKDMFADIEQGINQSDYPFLKPPGTPPQFSEASKLLMAIKSKLSYKASKDPEGSANERLNKLRTRLSSDVDTNSTQNEAMEVDCKEVKTIVPEPMSVLCKKDTISNKDNVILVVDTNIFIHELDFIKNIMNSQVEGYSKQPTLLVPWRVINELDKLKDNNNGYTAISKRARPAMDYLYKYLPENDRIKVQPLRDANNHIYPCESPDDEILNCCLQQAEKGNSVILLSNDKNLCTKARANNISHKKLEELPLLAGAGAHTRAAHTHAHDTRHIHTLLANILENEMRAKYDHLWLHVIFKPPPWSLCDVLQCILKHWIAVFNEVFPRIEHNITELKNCLETIESKDTKSLTQTEVTNFKELALEIAKRCQIIPEYMELAKKTVGKLQESASETQDTPEHEREQDSTKEMENGERHVIEALEKIWTVYSSYCAKLATHMGLPHNIEDTLSGGDSFEVLVDKLSLFGSQISNITAAMERLLADNICKDTMGMHASNMESIMKQSLNSIGVEVDAVNDKNIVLFTTKCRNMLQEAHSKFLQLVKLLEDINKYMYN